MNEKLIFKLLQNVEYVYNEKPKKYRFFRIYYQIIELIIKRYFDKLIFESLLSQDNIVEFLDMNEFAYKKGLLYKKDVIDENSFYGEMKNHEIVKTIKKDFEDVILQEIKNSTIITDVENYINIFCIVENNIQRNVRIYSIEIRFYRNFIINENKSKVIKTLIYGLLSIISLILIYWTFLIRK